jgi:membrane associated rhomboid family serine protease
MSQFKFKPVGNGVDMKSAVMNLIVINVIFFIAKFFANSKGIDLDNTLALHHPLSPDFHWFQFITCMFMHASVMHILFNMIGLYFFGRMLENVWGTKRFLIYYLVCGLGASAIYIGWETFSAVRMLDAYSDGQGWNTLMNMTEDPSRIGQSTGIYDMIFGVMLGASGAVYGLIMGAAMLFPNTTIYIYGAFPVKLKWLALIVGGIALYSGYSPSGDHVAHFAHLGGMIFGFILVKIYQRDRSNFF